ncbi:MAG: hypothetical protein R3C03_11305 [Pirellulaceae bacterium]
MAVSGIIASLLFLLCGVVFSLGGAGIAALMNSEEVQAQANADFAESGEQGSCGDMMLSMNLGFGILIVIGIAMLTAGLCLLVGSIGVLIKKNWGRIVLFIGCGLGFLLDAAMLVLGIIGGISEGNLMGAVTGTLIHVAFLAYYVDVFVYFNKPKIRRIFA